MQFEEFKALVQPKMEQDLSAVFEEFVEDSGTEDLNRFLDHLHKFGLIEGAVHDEVKAAMAGGGRRSMPSLPPPLPPSLANKATAEPVLERVTPAGRRSSIPPAVETPLPSQQPQEPADEEIEDDDTQAEYLQEAAPNATMALPPIDAPEDAAPAPAAQPAAPAEPAAPAGGDEGAKGARRTGARRKREAEAAAAAEAAGNGAQAADASTPAAEGAPAATDPGAADEGDASATGRRRRTGSRVSAAEEGGAGQAGAASSGARGRKSRTGRGMRAMEALTVPESVTERYDFVGDVGEGAMGKVLLALDTRLRRKVAFKQITAEIAQEGTLASKFTCEAQITAQLDHPNIVPVYSLEKAPDGMAAYTMKLIRGQTLEDLIAASREKITKTGWALEEKDPLSLDSLLEHFLKVCDALYYAHSFRGVVHRDLKPENIMVGAFNEIYVMDWGISKPYTKEVPEPVETIETEDEGELIIGTPQYMSPEQANGDNEKLSDRSDQYSLGLILYEIIALKPAVTGKSPLKIVMRQQDAEKDPLVHAAGLRIPFELKAIVTKATQKDPAKRYGNVHELAEDIKRYRRGEAVLAKRDRPDQAIKRWIRHHTNVVIFTFLLSGFATFLLIASIVAAAAYNASLQKEREARVSQTMSTVAAQASLIDGQFLNYQGLLSVIAVTATEHLERPPGNYNAVVYLDDEFPDPEKHPEDLADSKRYGMPISVDHPVYVLPEKVDRATVHRELMQLEPMRKQLRLAVLRSEKEEAASFNPARARRAISEVGTPIAWAYVGLANGLMVSYPGHGPFPANFQAQDQNWYQLAKDKFAPTWGAPSADVSGLGLILSCAKALYDDDQKLLGVAGIDVTFDFIIQELLDIEGYPDTVETFLVDEQGRIVVRSSKAGKSVSSASSRTIRMPKFPVEEVVTEVNALKSGYVETTYNGIDQLAVYHRMHSLGWYYVLMGPTDDVLAAAKL